MWQLPYATSPNKVFNTFISLMCIEMGSNLADEHLENVTLYDIQILEIKHMVIKFIFIGCFILSKNVVQGIN